MALQRMALYEALTRPAVIAHRATAATSGKPQRMPIPMSIKDGVRTAKRVYVNLPDLGIDARAIPGFDSIGPQIPPFPEMWIEYSITGSDIIFGALIRDQGVPAGESRTGIRTHFTLDFFALDEGAVTLGYGALAVVRDDGSLEELVATRVEDASMRSWSEIGGDEWDIHMPRAMAIPPMTAIGLMNCKNVKVEPSNRPITRSKKNRGKNVAKLNYHTIVLPGSSSSSGGTGECKGVMPQHKVRGHFKTFTAEAPLMGQHVGTYWWGWQVRGNKKNGITVTDYKVGA